MSASALAEDLRRHLENRPVRARPDTLGYHTAKFIERNTVGVAAATALALTLLVGGAATLWQARRAERRFQGVRRLAKAFLFDFHDAVRDLPGATAARRLVVSRGLEYLDDLAREAGGDRALQLELAAADLKVEDVQGKPCTPNLGDSAGALRSYAKAAEIAAPLAAAENSSKHITARRLASQAYASLGEVQTRLGDTEAATESHRRSLAISERAFAEDARHQHAWRQLLVTSQTGLGDAIQASNHRARDLERYRAALTRYQEALPHCEQLAVATSAASPESLQLAKTCSHLAGTLTEIGAKTDEPARFSEAFAFHQRNVALVEAAVNAQGENARFRRILADSLVARAYARTLARRELPGALEILEPLAAADPSNAEAQQDLSYAHYNAGRVLQVQDEAPLAAAEHYRRSLRILEGLVAAHPENAETAFDL